MVLLANRVGASDVASIITSVSSASLNLKTRSAIRRSSDCVSNPSRALPVFALPLLADAFRVFLAGLMTLVYFANATPTFTLRNLAGAAPWPVPIVCMGWPFPQLGVPQSVQWSREQIASQLFQNSVVIPL